MEIDAELNTHFIRTLGEGKHLVYHSLNCRPNPSHRLFKGLLSADKNSGASAPSPSYQRSRRILDLHKNGSCRIRLEFHKTFHGSLSVEPPLISRLSSCLGLLARPRFKWSM